MVEIGIVAAFVAGIVSFLSPCVLPLIPAFLAYLSGTSVGQKGARMKVFLNSVAYVIGFTSVFALLGVLLNSVLSGSAYTVQLWLSRIGGAVIIFFGLYLLGLIKLEFLQREYKFTPKTRFSVSYLTSFVFGAAFAVGWTPCVGAVLGSILVLAASQPGSSFLLLFAYALGLGIPFLVVGAFTTQALTAIRRLGPFLKYFNMIFGIVLIILGILVFTQTLNIVANLEIINKFLLR